VSDGVLTVAMPRGRPWSALRSLLAEAGVWPQVAEVDPERQLLWELAGMRWVFCRPSDVIPYVREGTADLGITGKDSLLEDHQEVYELQEVDGPRWRLSLAVPRDGPPWRALLVERGDRLRVATSYPRATRAFFARHGTQPVIVRLRGAVELAPMVGMADCIVDMVDTGATLAAHGLVEAEVVAPISLRVIGNQASYRWKAAEVADFCRALGAVRPRSPHTEKGGQAPGTAPAASG